MRLGIIGSLGWRLRLAGRDTLSSLGFAKLCACVCVGKGCARLFSLRGYVATRSSWRHLDRLAAQTQASALPSPDRERGVSYPRKVFPPACSLALLRNCLWRQPLPSSRSRPVPIASPATQPGAPPKPRGHSPCSALACTGPLMHCHRARRAAGGAHKRTAPQRGRDHHCFSRPKKPWNIPVDIDFHYFPRMWAMPTLCPR